VKGEINIKWLTELATKVKKPVERADPSFPKAVNFLQLTLSIIA